MPPGMITPEMWDKYVASVKAAMAESAGFQREQLSAQLQDAEAGRANAYKIANLQAKTQRYGIDVNSRDEMRKLEENARQFDQTHALDMQKFGLDVSRFGLEQQRFGLDYARGLTDYLSTPDRFAQANDYVQAAGRALQGLGPQPYSGGTFTAKTPEDFAALAAGKPIAGAPYGQAASGNLATDMQNAATSTAVDPRTKALKAIVDAVPPSDNPGMDPNDWAVATAFKALYGTGRQPISGTYQRMSPGQQAITRSEAQRAGMYAPDFVAAQTRNMIGQGNPLAV